MIGSVEGKIFSKGEDWLLVQTEAGVGYKVYCLSQTVDMNIGQVLVLYTHLVVRENVLALYGFLNEAELKVFERLIQVNGVGPKGALAILNLGDLTRLKNAIASEEDGYIALASGIGSKTASKVVIELKDKFEIDDMIAVGGSAAKELVQVLVDLGYSQLQARKILVEIDSSLSIEEQIRQALRLLGSK